ncbi:GTPase ObgE [Candidatus Poriferisodalis sp.]|uniref:GTPase ObgE n=1 Tax=Candidatus Poriferisodalis sp. TaxID=3101277 RepID=UPI003B022E8D
MGEFVDECQLHARGGDGGAGCVSFRRESHVPRGGPDGGDGGRGGDVWLVADRNVASLLAFRDFPFRRAANGGHGQGRRRHGRRGADQAVHVPEGTTVRDRDGALLADLVNAGDRWLAAQGGRGGKGNTRFASNRLRAPHFAEQAEPGEERWLGLELKLMADVALVGFPNAGKSTFIRAVSAARPKVASYPFTTLQPSLGVVRLDDGAGVGPDSFGPDSLGPDSFEMVIADVPGLIDGAAQGRGLGHQFLRHVERVRVLLIMVDLAEATDRDPHEQVDVLLAELERHDPALAKRRRFVVGTKADVAHLDWDGPRLSAVTGEGVAPVLGRLRELVVDARAADEAPVHYAVHRPAPVGITVLRLAAGVFEIEGRQARRAVALSDLSDPAALAWAQRRLEGLGASQALARAGAGAGDVVRIGDFEFTYEPDA